MGRDTGTLSGASHVDAAGAVTLRNVLIPPMTFRLTAHLNAARRGAIRWRMGQFWTAGITYPKNVARVFLFVLIFFHVSSSLPIGKGRTIGGHRPPTAFRR
jgi:hypothetical protein